MESILGSLFGGGGNPQQQAQDFVGRYQQGDLSHQEALQQYQQVAPQVPPQVYQQAAQQTFAGMSPEQRAQLGQMFAQQGVAAQPTTDPRELSNLALQVHQQQPGGLAALFGGGNQGSSGGGGGGLGSLVGNPLAKVALGGIAAMAIQHVLGGDSSSGRGSGVTI
jgi:hypothetical protein